MPQAPEAKKTDMGAIQQAILEQGTAAMAMSKGHPKSGEMIGMRIRTTDGWLIVATKANTEA
jgi:hypothetical protein